MCFETECIVTLQSHPRSLILAPIESTSTVTLALSCPISVILEFLYAESHFSTPNPYSGQNSECSLWRRSVRLGVCKERMLTINNC